MRAKFLLALLCLLPISAGAYWQSRLQVSAGATPATPPALDGTSNIVAGGALTTFTLTLSTTNANDIIIVHILSNTGVTLVADVAALTWAARTTAGSGATYIGEYYAKSTGVLTGDIITVTVPAGSIYNSGVAFGISGTTHFSSPFDSGSPQTTGSPPVSMTTATANDFVFGMCRSGGAGNPTPTGGTGTWTGIVSGVANSFMASGYQIFASPGALNFQISGSNTNCIVDAVIP